MDSWSHPSVCGLHGRGHSCDRESPRLPARNSNWLRPNIDGRNLTHIAALVRTTALPHRVPLSPVSASPSACLRLALISHLMSGNICHPDRPNISVLLRTREVAWHTFPSVTALYWYEKRIWICGSNRLRLFGNRCKSVQFPPSLTLQQVVRSSILAQSDDFPDLFRFPSPAPL